jgi:hypothetical protein
LAVLLAKSLTNQIFMKTAVALIVLDLLARSSVVAIDKPEQPFDLKTIPEDIASY